MKIIVIIIIVITLASKADYCGIIDTPLFKGKLKVLETRDEFLYKSKEKLDSDLK